MSVAKNSAHGEKIELPRDDSAAFWSAIEREYAAKNPHRWKMLAMLSLHENCGWSIDMLSRAFGHTKSTVSRKLAAVKTDVAARFHPGDVA